MPRDADVRLARAALVVAALMTCGIGVAQARTLYRWIDAQGRMQYADRPPIGFKGEVTRIEVEDDAAPRPAAPAPHAPRVAPEVLRDVIPPAPDIAKGRRDKRAVLEAAVRKAEAKVAAAKSALEAGGDMQDEERQVIQRRYAQAQAGRSNCRAATDANGKALFICPAIVPNEEYFNRQAKLEEAVKKAEDELDEAKAAYRRGVD